MRHEFSGKYVASGDTENGGKVFLWGPIPEEHAIRYRFDLTLA